VIRFVIFNFNRVGGPDCITPRRNGFLNAKATYIQFFLFTRERLIRQREMNIFFIKSILVSFLTSSIKRLFRVEGTPSEENVF
jgi:hypothetical protein